MMRTMSLEAYFDDQMPETPGEARPARNASRRRRSRLARLGALAAFVIADGSARRPRS